MRHIMVLNAKGGCGKSTLATNIASYFATEGASVALADYDPQRSSPSTTTYYYPATPSAAAPVAPPATITQRVPTEDVPEEAAPEDGDTVDSVMTKEVDENLEPEPEPADSPANQPAGEPKDSDDTGKPILDLDALDLLPPTPKSEETTRPASDRSA